VDLFVPSTLSYDEPAETQPHAFTHLLFALSFGLSAYNFFRAVTLDPGTAPKPSSDDEMKAVRRNVICHLSHSLTACWLHRSLSSLHLKDGLMARLSAYNAWCVTISDFLAVLALMLVVARHASRFAQNIAVCATSVLLGMTSEFQHYVMNIMLIVSF
jgi:hypothetical protein